MDPTTLNRQGNDVGTQYRSGIYFTRPDQEAQARALMDELTREQVFARPIVTEVLPLAQYSRAEAYHQHYFANNPGNGYCAFVVAPKVEKFKKVFKDKLK